MRAHGGVLRKLHEFFKEEDPTFGALVRVQNKSGEFFWVHEQFVDEF